MSIRGYAARIRYSGSVSRAKQIACVLVADFKRQHHHHHFASKQHFNNDKEYDSKKNFMLAMIQ